MDALLSQASSLLQLHRLHNFLTFPFLQHPPSFRMISPPAHWIPKCITLPSFWINAITPSPSSSPDPPLHRSQHSSHTLPAFPDIEDFQGCLVDPSHSTTIDHDPHLVSSFLHELPAFEMKAISLMCFLSNLAYIIPRIQPRELLKHHRLTFITSSLKKKAEAEAKLMAQIEQKKNNNTGANKKISKSQDETAAEQAVRPHAFLAPKQIPVLTMKADTKELQVEPIADLDSVVSSTMQMQAPSPINCPCEWFICDDLRSSIRHVAIQGSESLASWQTNLAFQPTRFEGLEILVHRGIYEAAQGLYQMLLPEILDHLRAHGELSRLRFTGHSLGGSLATLVALMLVIRGVIQADALLPVITFGAPCILCGGEYLLHQLGLKQNKFMSVIMHRDIVPRAFACDYPDHVAHVLKRLNSTFRQHPCLNSQRLLYAPMGQMLILQPDQAQSPGHPLLPSGGGLYLIRHPSNEQDKNNTFQMREVQRAFINMPHPLQVLRDPGAYGFEGGISRDHDPRSYSKAIDIVTKQCVKRLRRVQRHWRKQLWWPMLTGEAQGGSNSRAGTHKDKPSSGLELNSLRKSVFRESATTEYAEFSPACNSVSMSRKHKILNKYARLIASQHIHMGLLLILSLHMAALDICSSLFVWTC